MKIMLVTTSLGVGGAERLVTALADNFVKAGHEVLLVRFHDEVGLFPSDPRVELVNLEMRRSFMGFLMAMRRFRKVVSEFGPDVVNSHLVHANIVTRVLRLVTPISILISSAHNCNEEGWGRMVAYRLTDRLADISTNVSQDAVEAFEKQGALKSGRMVTVLNGIDATEFAVDETDRCRVRRKLGVDESSSLILAVGRLWQPKDYPNLLRAFARLDLGASSPQLAIAGDGPLHGELLALARNLGVKERVWFLGIRHDVPALLSAADLFVLSSAWEGFGLVVAEAMACECMPVATDCGGVREVVGDAGFLVPPRDSNALANAIEKALKLDLEEKELLKQQARKRVVEHFSLDATAQRYLQVYRGNNPGSESREPV